MAGTPMAGSDGFLARAATPPPEVGATWATVPGRDLPGRDPLDGVWLCREPGCRRRWCRWVGEGAEPDVVVVSSVVVVVLVVVLSALVVVVGLVVVADVVEGLLVVSVVVAAADIVDVVSAVVDEVVSDAGAGAGEVVPVVGSAFGVERDARAEPSDGGAPEAAVAVPASAAPPTVRAGIRSPAPSAAERAVFLGRRRGGSRGMISSLGGMRRKFEADGNEIPSLGPT